MKKLLIALVGVLLLGIAGAIAWLLMTPPATETAASISSSSQSSASASSSSAPKIGVMKKPLTQADILEAIDYEYTQNKDTVGWLKVPGTKIDNSVLQSYNNSYYLRINERKEKDTYGCYFMDYECSVGARGDLSPNTVIYGHSDLKDNPTGPRFSELFRFAEEEFSLSTPYLYFSTAKETMTWEVFAAYYTDTQMQYTLVNLGGNAVKSLAAQAQDKSIYSYNVAVGPEDKILTLSTCGVQETTDGTGRFVVMAKLVPPGTELKSRADIKPSIPAQAASSQ